MTPVTMHRLIPYVVGVAIGGVLLAALHCQRPDPAVLPPPLAAAVDRHAVATIVDSVEIHAAHVAATVAESVAQAWHHRAAVSDSVAGREHARADSLAALASRGDSRPLSFAVPDSVRPALADPWQAAYTARTIEADTLRSALAWADSSTAIESHRAELLDAALVQSEAGRAASDSLVRGLTAFASTLTPPCRVLHFFGCPSRTGSFVAGGILAAVGILALKVVK